MNSVYFVVDINPLPKERPRFDGRSKRAYTTSKTRGYENIIANAALVAMQGREPLTGDVTLAVVFRRKDRVPCDTDNLIKAVSDAANGILWQDDRQVTTIYAHVVRGSKQPGVSVIVEAA